MPIEPHQSRHHRPEHRPAVSTNQVPVSRFSPQALALAKYLPASSNPCGQLTYGIPNPSDESQYIGRADWLQNTRNTVFTRYFILNFNNPAIFDGTNGLTTSLAGQGLRSQSAVIGDNFSISPNVMNTARLTFTRLRDNRNAASNLFSLASAGVNIFQYDPHFINLSVSGGFSFGCGNCATSHFNRNTFQVSDSIDIVHGKHQIQLGVDYAPCGKQDQRVHQCPSQVIFPGRFRNSGRIHQQKIR